MADVEESMRTFKTAWFSKAARKARIKDDELCKAIQEVMDGQADDLGGGVFKKAPEQEHAQKHHSCERRPILDFRISVRKEGSG